MGTCVCDSNQAHDALALGCFVRGRRQCGQSGEFGRRVTLDWQNCVAWRLPLVIVPVLSSRTMSMSPATSTALPLLAMIFA